MSNGRFTLTSEAVHPIYGWSVRRFVKSPMQYFGDDFISRARSAASSGYSPWDVGSVRGRFSTSQTLENRFLKAIVSALARLTHLRFTFSIFRAPTSTRRPIVNCMASRYVAF